MPAHISTSPKPKKNKSLEFWIWDAEAVARGLGNAGDNKEKSVRQWFAVGDLVNASQIFEKGNPKNFIPDEGIQRIADLLIGWKEEEKLSRIAGIVAELDAIEAEARETDKALRKILKQLGV